MLLEVDWFRNGSGSEVGAGTALAKHATSFDRIDKKKAFDSEDRFFYFIAICQVRSLFLFATVGKFEGNERECDTSHEF